MGRIIDFIKSDFRFEEALVSCMGCGKCSAICPAAAYYDYDPRIVCTLVERNDEATLEELLKSDAIWQCGVCMSCKSRCPRENVPGLLIMVLRRASIEFGFFTESKLGLQQKELVAGIGKNLTSTGYCVRVDAVNPVTHPEQGPVWQWVYTNRASLMTRLKTGYGQVGSGALRNLSTDDMDEIGKIFDITGGTEFMKKIEGQ